MTYFTRKASRDYYLLSRKAYILGLIGWAHFLDRARLAKELTRERDPVHIQASRMVQAEEGSHTQPIMNDDPGHSGDFSLEIAIQEDCIDGEAGENGLLQFIAKVNGFSAWHFNQYDPDFFPSVPHGHWKEKETRKLDVYLGWVYEGTRQVSQEKRCLIIDLWNNEEFRRFAATAIDYYLDHHPSYKGWRVSNPRKLPVKR